MFHRMVDYDPVSGMRTDLILEDKKVIWYEEQDMAVAKRFEREATELRENDDYRRNGIKKGMMHAARIPQWVMAKLINEYGIMQPLRQADEVLKIMQRDFPWCMTAKGRY